MFEVGEALAKHSAEVARDEVIAGAIMQQALVDNEER